VKQPVKPQKPVAKPPEKLPAMPPASRQSWLDHLFFRIATVGWNRSNIAQYPHRLERHNRTLPPSVLHAFGEIDAKATGLLAHVSLMIAGLGLIAPLVVDSDVEKGVLIIEIAVYLLIAIGCLRCLAVFRFKEFGDGTPVAREVAFHELILRRELYAVCNRAAIYLTVFVFTLLPFLFLYKPGH
jgi:hypothetical protein